MNKQGKILTVTGGKGGVGKTFFSVNLGVEIVNKGYKVLLIDGDIFMSNTHIFTHIDMESNFFEALMQSDIRDCISKGAGGIDVIFAGDSIPKDFVMNEEFIHKFINSIQKLSQVYDFIIIDTSAGVSELVKHFIRISHDIILVTNPEITSLSDAFHLLKHTSNEKEMKKKDYYVVMNKARTISIGLNVLKTFGDTIKEEKLGIKISPLGIIVKNENKVLESIQKRIPIITLYENSNIKGCFDAITSKYLEKANLEIKKSFISKLLSN